MSEEGLINPPGQPEPLSHFIAEMQNIITNHGDIGLWSYDAEINRDMPVSWEAIYKDGKIIGIRVS